MKNSGKKQQFTKMIEKVILKVDIKNYVLLDELPDADPHVRWCERGRLVAAPTSIKLGFFLFVHEAPGADGEEYGGKTQQHTGLGQDSSDIGAAQDDIEQALHGPGGR